VGRASLSDIVETRTYVADPDQLAKYADIHKQYFGSASPARTILKPRDRKAVGAVKAKCTFEPWQALRGFPGPH